MMSPEIQNLKNVAKILRKMDGDYELEAQVCDDASTLIADLEARALSARAEALEEAARQIVEYSRPDRGVDASEYENEVLVSEENWLALRQALASLDAPTGTAEVGPDAEGGTTEMRWIPVSERLPDFNGEVLVAGPSFGVSATAMGGAWNDFGPGWTDGSITHWMPLPDPPTATAKETNDDES